jgi:hypothetical protein
MNLGPHMDLKERGSILFRNVGNFYHCDTMRYAENMDRRENLRPHNSSMAPISSQQKRETWLFELVIWRDSTSEYIICCRRISDKCWSLSTPTRTLKSTHKKKYNSTGTHTSSRLRHICKCICRIFLWTTDVQHNVEPVTTACRSSSDLNTRKRFSHNSKCSRRMLVRRFRVGLTVLPSLHVSFPCYARDYLLLDYKCSGISLVRVWQH